MTKHAWLVWLVPLLSWAVYLCWMTGYRNGYEAGHNDGWNTARRMSSPGAVLAEAHTVQEIAAVRIPPVSE